ncbi:Aste57867_18436 [Aphanomyces stellatus]|uniref:Aste57867_18436 protein n=1 Tax=Aphanomyces stellatus TaxID=120398 RepID=A0A485LAE7_9STRA|nr:hypothetical protein As57867_018374 [Aphanomyces stellatus]VFT95172.1 Aste57867_18436 [Aphanomyces stellatus]
MEFKQNFVEQNNTSDLLFPKPTKADKIWTPMTMNNGMSTISSSGDASPDASKAMKKRLLARRRQQRHRARFGNELETLRAEAADLIERVAALQLSKSSKEKAASDDDAMSSSSSLPWRDIAAALYDSAIATLEENQSLRRLDYLRHGHIEAALLQLMRQAPSKCPTAAVATTATWRDSTLLARSDLRALGLDWITLRMYQNTTRMFQEHGFPKSGLVKEFWTGVDAETDTMKYAWRLQCVVNEPMDVLRAAFRAQRTQYRSSVLWFRAMTTDAIYESMDEAGVDGTMKYGRVHTAEDDMKFYYVSREYDYGRDGCVFVGRHIADDEAMPRNRRQRNHLHWLVLEPMEGGQTRIRYLYTKSHQYTTDGRYVSLDEEALTMGCDVRDAPTEERKQAMYQAYATNAVMQCVSEGMLHFAYPIVEARALD